MSTNVSFNLVSLVFQSGCKSRKLISNWQMFFEVFLKEILIPFSTSYLPICQWTFPVLRGANVTSVFKSHKLFLNYFSKLSSLLIRLLVSISVNVYRCCGCKSTPFIYIYKGFYYIISIFFISRWYGGFYNTKFFLDFAGFGWNCLFGVGFATKAQGRKVFFIGYACFSKRLKAGVLSLLAGFSQRRQGAKPSFFLLITIISYENRSL